SLRVREIVPIWRTLHRRTSSPAAVIAIPATVSQMVGAASPARTVSSAIAIGSAVAVRWRNSHAPMRDRVASCCGGDWAETEAFIGSGAYFVFVALRVLPSRPAGAQWLRGARGRAFVAS